LEPKHDTFIIENYQQCCTEISLLHTTHLNCIPLLIVFLVLSAWVIYLVPRKDLLKHSQISLNS